MHVLELRLNVELKLRMTCEITKQIMVYLQLFYCSVIHLRVQFKCYR